jgi:preprotein translocase subunit SecG
MYNLFVILIVLVAILMVAIVLIQESKGGGLASNFSSSNAIMGVRKTTDFIEKATWFLAGMMVVCSIICAHVAPTSSTEESVIEKQATENSTANPNNLPNFGASQQKQAAGDNKQAPATNAKQAPAAENAAPAADAQAPAAKK